MAHYHIDDSIVYNRWDNTTTPRVTIQPGDTVTLDCHDASDNQVVPGISGKKFGQIDFGKIHALTGPIAIDGAEPGDQLVIDILNYQHRGYAWTSIIPGLGLLDDFVKEHFLFHWELEDAVTHSMPGVTLDLAPFCGIIGVQRAEPGSFRTRPPGTFGGNMDVRHLTAGTRLHLPVQVTGGMLCAGDCHAAQGDGEVSINGMEAPMQVTFKLDLIKQTPLAGPYLQTSGRLIPERYTQKPFHGFVASHEDPREACKIAVLRAIDYITGRIPVSPKQAYVLCSVVLDLKVSQLVNTPLTTITAYLPEAIFN
ncbi:MAG: acetamidase/formamidase family protein [Opitutales bacterium]|nr:acetamidase/formamidase family protein [Opitutales bacterium]